VLGGDQVGAGVVRVGVGRQRYVRNEPAHRHPHRGVDHHASILPVRGVGTVTSMEHPDPRDPRLAYSERLSVPWLWWPAALGLAALLAAQVGLGAPGPVTWVPYLMLLPGTVIALWWLGRIRISVVGDELRVD